MVNMSSLKEDKNKPVLNTLNEELQKN